MKNLKRLVMYSLFAGIFLAVGFVAAFAFTPKSLFAIGDVNAPQVATNQLLVNQETTYSQIYDTVAPAVVAISVHGRQRGSTQWSPINTGSGFVVDTLGHIVTNNHVVANAISIDADPNTESLIEVAMFDGTLTRAQVVGADPDSDIAVIRVNVSQDRLRPVSFANSDALIEGQIVFALGNPFANDWTLTTGIISALNRSIGGLDVFRTGGVIQTDAAINPGNSGGPLVNINGQVIGVNSQINSESGSNSGVGFAVPSNLVVRVADSLIATGDVQYSYLGIEGGSMSLTIIEGYQLPNNIRGAVVSQVSPRGPAGIAGIQGATNNSIDIITAIDGHPIADFDELIGYLGIHTIPGNTVVFTVYRNGQVLQIPVTLSPRPN